MTRTSGDEIDLLAAAIDPFGSLSTVERTPRIELKSSFGLSNLRDIQTTAGSATIASVDGEFRLRTTASGTDSATLDSAERGQYIPGSISEAGLGVRSPDAPAAGQEILWGYGDDDDGLFFGRDADGLFVRRRSGGTDHDTRRADWSRDSVDGLGPSGLTLDVTDGHVYQVDFAWYGYGVLEWVVYMPDLSTGRQKKITLHREQVEGSLSIENPNLPIRAEIDNGGTANALDLFVAGRQYAIIGRSRPNERINGEFRSLSAVGETFLPVISFQKKAAFRDVPVRLRRLETLATADMRYQIRLDSDLTDASFGALSDTSAGETALEVDTSATAISGGEILMKGLIASGAGGNKTEHSIVDLLSQVIPPAMPVTLAVRTVSGTGESVHATWTLREEW